jgi:hypothetical protein
VRRGIGQRIDDLHLLDDRAGPSMRDHDRHGILVLRLHMNEVNVEPVDLGDEVRNGVQLRLALAPVVLGSPIARELPDRLRLHALRVVVHRFTLGPLGRINAAAQVGEVGV